ncbi:MAG: PEP-CTERM sorting domain-containing protein [Verrucomicrobiia bacterium]
MKTITLASSFLILLATTGLSQFTVVAPFNPNNNATSITSTGSETISLSDFISALASAHASGTGGTINFDNATLSLSTSFTASWGPSNAYTLNVGAGLGFNDQPTNFGTSTNTTNRTPSSGGQTLFADAPSDGSFVFTFNLSDQITHAGGVMVARTASTNPTFRAQALFSDGVSPYASSFFDISPLNVNNENVFAGFVAPSGFYITELRFYNINPGEGFRNFDDLGFISAIPEPSTTGLLALGAAAAIWLLRRRRPEEHGNG